MSDAIIAFIFVIHIIFSWSSILSYLLLVGDLGLIGFLTMRAYQDGKYTYTLHFTYQFLHCCSHYM